MTAKKIISFAAGAGLLFGAATAAMAQSGTTTQDPTPRQGRALGPQDEMQGPSKGPNNVGTSPQDRETGQRNTPSADDVAVGNTGAAGRSRGMNDDKKPDHN